MQPEFKETFRTGRWAAIWEQHGKVVIATAAPGLLICGLERGGGVSYPSYFLLTALHSS